MNLVVNRSVLGKVVAVLALAMLLTLVAVGFAQARAVTGFHTEYSPGYEKHYAPFERSFRGSCSPYGPTKTIYVHQHKGYGYFGSAISNEFYEFARNC